MNDQTHRRYMTNMTLGRFIEVLRSSDPKAEVLMDFGRNEYIPAPWETFCSYRGNYENLALTYEVREHVSQENRMTVARLLDQAEIALHVPLTGFKGGSFQMSPASIMWSAQPDDSSNRAITGIAVKDDTLHIQTGIVQHNLDDEEEWDYINNTSDGANIKALERSRSDCLSALTKIRFEHWRLYREEQALLTEINRIEANMVRAK